MSKAKSAAPVRAAAAVAATAAPAASAGSSDSSVSSLAEINDTWFESLLRRYVTEPTVRLIPRWVKPNTISLLNHTCGWLQLVLAFLSVYLDEHSPSRWGGFVCRILVAVLTFAMMVMDCLDGMHARGTGQCSQLGEVMDHALDSANIPLLCSGVLVLASFDYYSVAIAMVASGFVFNTQLTVYRATHRLIPPPVSGPESQMMVVILDIVYAVVFLLLGRFHPYVALFIVGTSVVGNIVQFKNTWYFWQYLDRRTVADHLRFAALTVWHAVVFLLGLMSFEAYVLSATMMTFRLNGCYVLFTVATKYKDRQDKENNNSGSSSRPLVSRFTSLHSGMDWPLALWLVVFSLRPWLGVWGAEWPTVILFSLYTVVTMYIDLMDSLPYLLLPHQKGKSFLQLLI